MKHCNPNKKQINETDRSSNMNFFYCVSNVSLPSQFTMELNFLTWSLKMVPTSIKILGYIFV